MTSSDITRVSNALERLAEAQRQLAFATIYAAAYTANKDASPNSYALDAVHRFKSGCP